MRDCGHHHPNTTEAAILLDWDPAGKPRSAEEAWEWLRALRAQYPAQVVLTGLDFEEGRVGAGCLSDEGGALSMHRRIDRYYPGNRRPVRFSDAERAAERRKARRCVRPRGEYVKDCIAYTAAQQTDPMHGVQFEKLLYKLIVRST